MRMMITQLGAVGGYGHELQRPAVELSYHITLTVCSFFYVLPWSGSTLNLDPFAPFAPFASVDAQVALSSAQKPLT